MTSTVLKYLRVSQIGGDLLVAFAPLSDFRIGEHGGKRFSSGRRIFKALVDEIGGSRRSADEAILRHDPATIRSVHRVDRRLVKMFDAPVSAKAVRSVLGVTSPELSRWDRDGKLPAYRRQHIGSSTSGFSVAVYDPDLIGRLQADKGVIARWRAEDRSIDSHVTEN